MYPNLVQKLRWLSCSIFVSPATLRVQIQRLVHPIPSTVAGDLGVFFHGSCMSYNGHVEDRATVSLLQAPTKWLSSLFFALFVSLPLSLVSLSLRSHSITLPLFLFPSSSLSQPSLSKVVLALITPWLKAEGGVKKSACVLKPYMDQYPNTVTGTHNDPHMQS